MADSVPENPDFVGHCLLRLATLSAALAGGGIFLLTDWTMGLPFRIATGFCLAAFALALGGLARRSSPGGAASLVEARWRWFNASAATLLAALSTALVGIVLR